eukprot:2314924-Alexandrium_andersonii.AAC.1
MAAPPPLAASWSGLLSFPTPLFPGGCPPPPRPSHEAFRHVPEALFGRSGGGGWHEPWGSAALSVPA